MNTMTKLHLAEIIRANMQAAHSVCTWAEAESIVDTMLSEMAAALATGNEVRLHNFGTFSLKKREAREGHNPRTGAKITIAASRAVAFKPGRGLKATVNA